MTPEQREWFDRHRTAQYGLCKVCGERRSAVVEGSGQYARSRIVCQRCQGHG